MNQALGSFQSLYVENKDFVFVQKPKLSIQQLDIKLVKSQKREILHRRKSEIDLRKIRKKKQKQNEQEQIKLKLPCISKKVIELQCSEPQSKQEIVRKLNLKRQKKHSNFFHAKSISLLKRSKSNFDCYQVENQELSIPKESNQNNVETDPNQKQLQQLEYNQTKKFYINDIKLNVVQTKDQLNRRALIQKLILKKQEQLKLCAFLSSKSQNKLIKNNHFSLKHFSKQLENPNQIFSKKLQINAKQKEHKIKLLMLKPHKPSFYQKPKGQTVQGWQIHQQQEEYSFAQ